MRFYPAIVMTLGFFAIVVVAGGLALLFGLAGSASRERLAGAFRGQERHPLVWAWMLSLTATASSLYLSEVAGLIPCSLCWYQRFMMYPLVLVLGVAALRGWIGVWRFGLPLSVIGLAISTYHVSIQWQPSLDVGACSSGVPCSGRYLAVFGFISIPTMAGAIFLAVTALLLLLLVLERRAAFERQRGEAPDEGEQDGESGDASVAMNS